METFRSTLIAGVITEHFKLPVIELALKIDEAVSRFEALDEMEKLTEVSNWFLADKERARGLIEKMDELMGITRDADGNPIDDEDDGRTYLTQSMGPQYGANKLFGIVDIEKEQ